MGLEMTRQQRRAKARAERWQLLRSPYSAPVVLGGRFIPRRERRAKARDLSKVGW